MRLATWNLGSLTGRGTELSDVLKRRCIDACCLQETRWKGSKSRILGNGYKLLYHGTTNGRNGVGIVLSEKFTQRILHVERVSDRLMAVKIALEGQPCTNIISAYAPQANCSEDDKDAFWEDLNTFISEIPEDESLYLGADLNGHVGENNINAEQWHGGFGFGTRNADGDRILEFAARNELAIVNTYFKKKIDHLVTYRSGRHMTQIDYALVRRKHLGKIRDCKVIPGEALTSQHRLLISVQELNKPVKCSNKQIPKIKWKSLNTVMGSKFVQDMEAYFETKNTSKVETANDMWNDFETFCRLTAETHLGRTRCKRAPFKETKWWQQSVKDAVQAKKLAFKKWQETGDDTDKADYNRAKSNAKREVAIARAKAEANFYKELESSTTEINIHKVAKDRNRKSKDITSAKYITDKNNKLLTEDNDIRERWAEYYRHLLNVTNPRNLNHENPSPVLGPTAEVTTGEIIKEIRNMKNNKAQGPSEIPIEVWKHTGHRGIDWLRKLFNRLIAGQKIPDAWRRSHLIPFYKGKGDVRDCGNYRAIKLMDHTFKLWERIINSRLNCIVKLTPNQCGFVAGKGTSDAIQAIRILIEKAKHNSTNLHMIFIDLEKAFDHVPRDLIWEALRAQLIPEVYINLIMDMYADVTTQVICPAGMSDSFELKVGVHQGSTLSPLLFNVTMDYLTQKCQRTVPWHLLYADDVALIAETETDLQRDLNSWVDALEGHGLKISRKKTEHMSCLFDTTANNPENVRFYIGTDRLPTVTKFKYLGSVLSSDGKIDSDIVHRTQTGWMKWRELTGVLCDRKIPLKVKGHVYKTAVRPALLYGSECWATNKAHLNKLHTTEMRMLRWSAGVTMMDKIKNVYIRGSFKVAPITEKLTEKRLRWYGHVQRRPENYMVKVALEIPTRKRGPGRRPPTWLTTVQRDLKDHNIDADLALNRAEWKKRTGKADPK
ncbi:uncharacterized protein LOC125228012 [Leguminivora glycinivorella]|uniref:uncharacterized protein LOC125228012 n=1 Tax=Leguminivora glycinivorella TaxID=1035111 RepID=UPI0020100E00|nr:uncharacterized protein LOC125228012 [Leguminivora glycinivorella]